jgi:AcrR family transcriptional regulator
MFEPALVRFESGVTPIRERVAEFVRQSVVGVEEWSSLCASVAQVWAELGADEGSPLRVLMKEQYSSSADRIAAAFERAVTSGDAAPFATRRAALALMALLDGLLLQAMILGESAIREIVTPGFLDWCCSLVPGAEPSSKVSRC